MTTLDKQTRERLDPLVEAFVDAELSPEEQDQILRAISVDSAFAKEVDVARQIAVSLRSIPEMTCPDHVARGVMAHVRRDVRRGAWKGIEEFFLSLNAAFFKPALAMAMLFLIVLSSTRIGRPVQESSTDVARALNDVKWTLAYLSDAGKATASTVRAEVIENQVVAPVNRAFTPILEN